MYYYFLNYILEMYQMNDHSITVHLKHIAMKSETHAIRTCVKYRAAHCQPDGSRLVHGQVFRRHKHESNDLNKAKLPTRASV